MSSPKRTSDEIRALIEEQKRRLQEAEAREAIIESTMDQLAQGGEANGDIVSNMNQPEQGGVGNGNAEGENPSTVQGQPPQARSPSPATRRRYRYMPVAEALQLWGNTPDPKHPVPAPDNRVYYENVRYIRAKPTLDCGQCGDCWIKLAKKCREDYGCLICKADGLVCPTITAPDPPPPDLEAWSGSDDTFDPDGEDPAMYAADPAALEMPSKRRKPSKARKAKYQKPAPLPGIDPTLLADIKRTLWEMHETAWSQWNEHKQSLQRRERQLEEYRSQKLELERKRLDLEERRLIADLISKGLSLDLVSPDKEKREATTLRYLNKDL